MPSRPCRKCGKQTRCLEVAGVGGGHFYFHMTPEFEATVGPSFWNDSAEWLCRFFDAHACPDCNAIDLTLKDLATFLSCDGPHLPKSPAPCAVCNGPCLGLFQVRCLDIPGVALAYLDVQYGSELVARLCTQCGLIWLSLYPDDEKGREELAARFPSDGRCDKCGTGHLRLTRADVPHSGVAGLLDPKAERTPPDFGFVGELWLKVCVACGEAEPRAKW